MAREGYRIEKVGWNSYLVKQTPGTNTCMFYMGSEKISTVLLNNCILLYNDAVQDLNCFYVSLVLEIKHDMKQIPNANFFLMN